MTLSIQWFTITVMMMSGIGMGVLFDGYRVVSHELRFPRWMLAFLDIIYWMACAIVVFRLLYVSNNGEVRAYVYIGLAIGVLLYYLLCSRLVVALVKWLINVIRKCINFIYSCCHYLIVKPLILLWKFVKYLLGIGTAITIYLFKLMLQLTRPLYLFVSWLMRPVTTKLKVWGKPLWEKWKIEHRIKRMFYIMRQYWNKWLRRK